MIDGQVTIRIKKMSFKRVTLDFKEMHVLEV